MGRFFLSYSRADQDLALKFANDLKAAGADIWVDQIDIKPSERWDRSVEAGLRDSVGIVLMMSPRSVASENVLDEVSIALDAGKQVIPVLIEACQAPLRLARVQFIDATRDYGAALAQCKTAMGGGGSTSAPAPSRSAISSTVIDMLAQRLTPLLGPISRHLVENESRAASSPSDLIARVAARVPDGERSRFLASVRDLG
jgi:hypothetical protein